MRGCQVDALTVAAGTELASSVERLSGASAAQHSPFLLLYFLLCLVFSFLSISPLKCSLYILPADRLKFGDSSRNRISLLNDLPHSNR